MEKYRNSGAVSKRDFLAIEQALNSIRSERDNYSADTHKKNCSRTG